MSEMYRKKFGLIRVVGATKKLTKNKVTLDTGQKMNVLCGADILLSGWYQNLKGETSCPVCERRIEVAIEDRRVFLITPPSALLHYVVEGDPTMLGICCEATFIFDKEDCLNSWRESYRGRPGKVSSLTDFMEEVATKRGNMVKLGERS